jgi:hypothetical protein
MTSPLDWSVSIPEAGAGERTGVLRASAAELDALAAELGVLSIAELSARYAIVPIRLGRYRITGEIEARLTQACVVTLDPVPAAIIEPLDVELWPAGEIERPSGREEQEVLAAADIEPIDGVSVDFGRIVFEHISAALDPYPRKPGAEFEWDEGKTESGPFAVLAKLKQEQ